MLLLEVPLLIGTLLYLHLALPGHRSAQRRLSPRIASWGRNKLAGRAGPQELLDIGQELEEQNHHQDRDEVSDGQWIRFPNEIESRALWPGTEDSQELTPMDGDDAQNRHKWDHFQKAVHVLFDWCHAARRSGVADIPNGCRLVNEEITIIATMTNRSWLVARQQCFSLSYLLNNEQ
jgi:hypothetical protein